MKETNRIEINRLAKELQTKLEAIDLPYREIHCFGSQINIECISREACEKWASVVSEFAKVRTIIETITETKQTKDKSEKKYIKIHRLYANI